MIRVTHVITGVGAGGAEAMLAKLLANADRERFDMRVVALTAGEGDGPALDGADAPLQTLGLRRGVPDPRGLAALVRLLRRERPDVVQTWLYHADLLGLMAAPFAGRPPVVWNLRCSNMEFARYRPLTRWVVRVLARTSHRPAAVVVNSQAGRRFHESLGYRARRWELVPNGFDLDRFRPDAQARGRLRRDFGWPDDAVVIGHVARLDPMKDHAGFLAAAARVAAACPAARFLLVGRGTDSLAATPAARTLGPRLRAAGERRDVDRLMPGFDLFCLSSAFGEGFPNVLGEAMATAVPCVTTDVGDAAAIVADTGCVVPPRDPGALAAAMIESIGLGAEARARRGQAARTRISEQYALPRIVARYQALYADLVDGKRQAAKRVTRAAL